MSTLKMYKPTTAARRHTSVIDYKKVLSGDKPHKPLISRIKKNGGRNSSGKITVRHKGNGARAMYRHVDFKQKFEDGFKVLTVEYDPNRSAFICLVEDLVTLKKSYIIHTFGLMVGTIITGKNDKESQNAKPMALKDIPMGAQISQVQMNPGQDAKMVRSAGTYAILMARENGMAMVKLPSGEVRRFLETCQAVVGRVGNTANNQVRIGKAGRNRHKGIRPTVRGKVMNPVDHPHGGGEARNSIGMKYPKTPWGKHALGVKTRSPKKASNKFIVSRRKK